uniref:Rapunzel 4 n=1 Tax=Salmo trutta TaxID=8032 RepID=A0A674CVL3_SALTR
MASRLKLIVAEKKNVIETVMEVFEQGAEVVASIAGDLFLSKEAGFMKEQFQNVCECLEVENISNQFRKYMDILNAKHKFCEVKKKLFMKRLNPIFYIGFIALMDNTALKDCGDEEMLLQDWGKKMKDTQVIMNAVIEDCINSVSKQAELDSWRLVMDHSDLNNQQLADTILEKLKKKYDWVRLSVCIFSSPSGLFSNKKDIQCPTGKNHFQVAVSDEKLNVMVSYNASPEPLNKAHIQ